eukprot:3826173-Heterocapsa_arctica.AAC.1
MATQEDGRRDRGQPEFWPTYLASAKPRTLRLTAERTPIIVYVGGAEENEGGVATGAVYSTRSTAPRSTSRSTCPTTPCARGSARAARRGSSTKPSCSQPAWLSRRGAAGGEDA